MLLAETTTVYMSAPAKSDDSHDPSACCIDSLVANRTQTVRMELYTCCGTNHEKCRSVVQYAILKSRA